MSAEELATNSKGGWELVSHSAHRCRCTIEPTFDYVFKYVGGLGSNRAVHNGN